MVYYVYGSGEAKPKISFPFFVGSPLTQDASIYQGLAGFRVALAVSRNATPALDQGLTLNTYHLFPK